MSWTRTVKSFGAVIITGASSGIGTAFSLTLRKVDGDVLLCNLSRRRPAEFAENSRSHHWSVDLSDPVALAGGAEAAMKAVADDSQGPVLLINNSGFGECGRFGAAGRDELGMIDVNVRAAVDLTARCLPLLRERGGWIVNIASLAGFQPTPYMATYGATKAFILHWSLALGEELRGSGVGVLAVCPGPTESQFHRRAGFTEPLGLRGGQTAEAVVEETFRAVHRGRSMIITGCRNRWVERSGRCLPKPMIARIARMVLKRLRLDALPQPSSDA